MFCELDISLGKEICLCAPEFALKFFSLLKDIIECTNVTTSIAYDIVLGIPETAPSFIFS
jgi:hypothetical protein